MALVLTGCESASVGSAAQPTTARGVYVSPTLGPTSSANVASERATGPVSAGAVSDAGVVFVIGADDQIHRYDGSTGALAAVAGRSSFGPRTAAGVFIFGREGGAALLGWDGRTSDTTCGGRFVTSVTPGVGCTGLGDDGVYVQLGADAAPRRILPADWGAGATALSPDGLRIAVVRRLEQRPPGPGLDPGLSALWIIEPDGRPYEVYRPSAHAVLTAPVWSPDGTKLIVRQNESTSASFAADLVGIETVVVDLSTRASYVLGHARSETWSSGGALAFVLGQGRETWREKHLWVLYRDGRRDRVAGDAGRVALAPAWGPGDRIAWVDGPTSEAGDGDGYIDGAGAGRRVGIVGGLPARAVRCGAGRAVEGLTWSESGGALLLLCRKPGSDPRPLELWLYRLTTDTAIPLVTNLPSDRIAGGFGFYGAQPAISSVAAWSLALSR